MLENTQIERLLLEAKNGDKTAFESLMERYRSRVQRFVAARIRYGLGPKPDAEEILQETYTRAYAALDRLEWRGDEALFQWLCSIAKHVLLAASRKSRRDEGLEDADGLPASDVSPSRLVRRNERFERRIRDVASQAVAHLKRGDTVTVRTTANDRVKADRTVGADPVLRFLALLEPRDTPPASDRLASSKPGPVSERAA